MRDSVIPYVSEYRRSQPFWGSDPGSLMQDFQHLVPESGSLLDLGAGEGKNSVFAASLGLNVVAVDASVIALQNFDLHPIFAAVHHRVERIGADVRHLEFQPEAFDIVVAYGLLHCLNQPEQTRLLGKMRRWTSPGGIHVVVALEDSVPVDPVAHPYLNDADLVSRDQLSEEYAGCERLHLSVTPLRESHPTTAIEHSHSVLRLVARMPGLAG